METVSPDGPPLLVPTLVARRLSDEFRQLDDKRRDLESQLTKLPPEPSPLNEQSERLGWKVQGYDNQTPARQWVEIDLGREVAVDAVVLIPADDTAPNAGGVGYGFPRRFSVEAVAGNGTIALIADYRARDFPNPGSLPVFLPASVGPIRKVVIRLNSPWNRDWLRAYAFSEIMVLAGNRNLATGFGGVAVRTSGSMETPPAWSRINLIDGQSLIGPPLIPYDWQQVQHGWRSSPSPTPDRPAWAVLDLGREMPLQEVRLFPARLAQFSMRVGYGFPRGFRMEVANEPDFSDARQLSPPEYEKDFPNPAFNPVTIPAEGAIARYVRVTATELWRQAEKEFLVAWGEIEVFSSDRNVAREAVVTVSDSLGGRFFAKEFLVDGIRASQRIVDLSDWLRSLSRRRELQRELAATEAALAAQQPELVRLMTWLTAVLAVLVALGVVILIYRGRLTRIRHLSALQRRIAGDLHDEVGSNLANIALMAELAYRSPNGIKREELDEIHRLARESATAMRDIVWLTLPGPHDAAELKTRLRATVARMLTGHTWEFTAEQFDEAASLEAQRHLLLALKEMLANVVRHACAQHVWIALGAAAGRFELRVEDDGCGLPPAISGEGHGLASLRHRAHLLAGEFTLAPRAEGGTVARLVGVLQPSMRSAYSHDHIKSPDRLAH